LYRDLPINASNELQREANTPWWSVAEEEGIGAAEVERVGRENFCLFDGPSLLLLPLFPEEEAVMILGRLGSAGVDILLAARGIVK
jgi:hypothetical protein